MSFSDERATRALQFISALTHTKDRWAGKDFQPRPWQQAIIRELFGRMRADDSNRRAYRTCYIEIPRKNGKSELAAAFALYGLVGDRVIGAEVYSAAADREQASLVFNMAAQMVRNDARLSARLKIIDSQKRIIDHQTGSFYRALSAEAYSKHGFNASMVIYDELHAAPNRDLWDVLSTSMGTRSEPLMMAITTAGFDRHSICWEQRDYAQKILEGSVTDPTFYPVIYAAPDDADWTDEAVWRNANPALEDFRDIEDMRALAHKAREIHALQNTFRRLYLNQWTEQAERWIDMKAWDACAGDEGWKQLRERMKDKPCHAALDLSKRNDITALALVFDDDGRKVVVPFFWVPEEGARRRSRVDRVPYDQWIRDGLITATPGETVDHNFVRRDINALAKSYQINMFGFDDWDSSMLFQALRDYDGFKIAQVPQGFKGMSEPTNELGALVLDRRLRHGAHPVLRWMAANMVVHEDPAGNIAPDKGRATERIDGIVALIMALKFLPAKAPEFQIFVFGGRH